MMPFRCTCIAWLIAALAACSAPPSEADLREAVRQLGDKSFPVREKAMRLLWNAGDAAEAVLREAANSPDAEVQRRARQLLDRIAYRIDPGTPAEVGDLLLKFRTAAGAPAEQSQVIRELLRIGSAAHKNLLRLLDTVDEKTRRLVFDEFVFDDWKILSALMAEGQDRIVEQLIDKALAAQIESIIPHHAAFHLQAGSLDARMTAHQPRFQAGGVFDARVQLALSRAKGDLVNAVEAARRTENPFWLRQTRMELGQWAQLLERSTVRPAGGLNAVTDLGYRAAYMRLAGQTQGLPAVLKEIEDYTGEKQARQDNRPWFAAKVLLVNEQPRLAANLLEKHGLHTVLVELLVSQGKYRDALARLEQAAREETGTQYLLRSQLISLLIRFGEGKRAREVLDALGKDMAANSEPGWLDRRIDWEAKLGNRTGAEKLLLERIERRDGSSLALAFAALFPVLGELAEPAWHMLCPPESTEKPADVLVRLRQIEHGKLPEKEIDALLSSAVPVNRHTSQPNFEPVARLTALLGRADVAQILLHAAHWEKSPASARLHLADALAQARRWPDAAKAYRRVWESDKAAPLPLFLHAQSILMLQPRDADALAAIERAHRAPLGGDSVRWYFYQALLERGWYEGARRELNSCSRLLANNTWVLSNVQDHLARYLAETGKFQDAAAMHERNVLRMLPTSASPFRGVGGYSRVTSGIHTLRARGLLADGKKAQAFAEIDRAEELHPANLEIAIQLVPALEQAGENERAGRLFERTLDVWLQASRDFPRAADPHNQVAWLCARCRRRLDLALEHARQAVELAPDTPSYLDTLAEVHFQRGGTRQALDLMRQCLKMPGANVAFYRQQLSRFEKGDPKIEPRGE